MFPYSNCPQELKVQILNCVPAEDSLELLKTNRTLRNQILQKGPFPTKIEEVYLNYGDLTVDLPENTELSFYLRITEGKDFQKKIFRIQDLQKLLVVDGEMILMETNRFIFSLINKTRSCRKVEIELRNYQQTPDGGGSDMSLLINLYDKVGFLPNLRFISKFTLLAHDFSLRECFLKNFNAKLIDECELEILNDFEKHRDIEGIIGEFLAKPTIRDCKRFVWKYEKGLLLNEFSKTKAESIVYKYSYWDEFKEYSASLLDFGIPSGDPATITILFLCPCPRYFDHFYDGDDIAGPVNKTWIEFLQSFPSLTSIDEHSDEAKAILSAAIEHHNRPSRDVEKYELNRKFFFSKTKYGQKPFSVMFSIKKEFNVQVIDTRLVIKSQYF